MVLKLARASRRMGMTWSMVRCWLVLRSRVSGRIKLRGDVRHIAVDRSFRCDGDLWLGVHSDEGAIVIEANVSASGPLVVTAVRPLRIGAGTLFGPNVLVTDHYHGDSNDAVHRALPPSRRPLHSPGPIEIGNDVQLGANAVVLSPTWIGRGAIVAANAVVKGQVPAMSVHTGVASASPRRDQATATKTGE
jgi:acetyltransferase-like isoleucine patch superfamily enzyme